MWSRLLVALAFLLLAAPAAAGAATVEFTAAPSSFRVKGDEGSDNLRITAMSDGALDVADPSQPVTVRVAPTSPSGAPCTTVDEHHVHCQGTASTVVDVDAGRGDDRVTVDGSLGLHTQLGGAGFDVLRGGAGDDTIDGGAGDDIITGSPGRDVQRGGEGHDRFMIAQEQLGDGETLDGGPGQNSVEVTGDVAEALEIDLQAGRIVSPRGTTTLVSFQDAAASIPNAVLLGDDGPNGLRVSAGGRADGRGGDDYVVARTRPATLVGGAGDDVLRSGEEGGALWNGEVMGSTLDGGPGDDELKGGAYSTLDGGPGDDALKAHGSSLLAGGPGDDSLTTDDRRSTLLGGDGDDALASGADAKLAGGSGDDLLTAGTDSTLDGGAGDDRLSGLTVERVVCGPGRDVVSDIPPPRPADCEGSPTWFGFLGAVGVTGHALRAAINLSEYDHFCGAWVQAVTPRGRPVTTPVRTRQTKPMSLSLPLRAGTTRPPVVVRLRVRIARSCASGRRPWRYDTSGPSVLLKPAGRR